MLTSLPELDRLVLLFLAPRDIWSYSQVCRQARHTCDESLWQALVRRDFQTNRRYGPANLQYQYLSKVTLHQALETGRIDALEHLHHRDPVCEYEAEEACRLGHLEMFKWIIDQGVGLTERCLELAISNSRHDVFEHLWSLGLRVEELWFGPSTWPMAERLISLGLTPDVDWANYALFSDDRECLDHYYEMGILPTIDALETACQFDCYDMMTWMVDHGCIPTVECANIAAIYGQMKIIQYLYRLNIRPDRVDHANEEVKKWLKSQT